MFGDFNFDARGGAGGAPGAQAAKPRAKLDNQRYYDLLGVATSATDDQLKKAYRKKALTEHPDKGGDVAKFQEITKAYETLKDPQERAAYDKYGEEGMKRGGAGPRPEEMFSNLFGGDSKAGPKKTKSIIHPIKCTLEDLYKGKSTRIKVSRNRLKKTDGPQDESNPPKPEKQPKVLECVIDKGAPDGEKYIFHGESDEHPKREAGDVVFVVAQQQHPIFKRRGADLLMNKEITLMEALCGVDFLVDHLDGTQFRVKTEQGMAIQPDQILTVEEKGMPFHKNPFRFGNLFVMFKVQFPDQISAAQKTKVKEAISALEGMQIEDKVEEQAATEALQLQKYNKNQRNPNPEGGAEAADEEKTDWEPSGAQCMNQ